MKKCVIALLILTVVAVILLLFILVLIISMTMMDPDQIPVATEPPRVEALKFIINCFKDSDNCDSENGTVAIDFNDCCIQTLGVSYQNLTANTCVVCSVARKTSVIGDPHFVVPLQSGEMLCYSIQGYPGLAFSLIHSKTFNINAQFVDNFNDTSEATWIGKLAVISQHAPRTQMTVFDSINKEVIIFGYGKMKAAVIKSITFYESGKIKFIQDIKKQMGNPTIHVQYINNSKEYGSFDIEFHKNHLDINWNLQYDKLHELDGLIGQFIHTSIEIDTQRKMLIFSDSRSPLPVINDFLITSNSGAQCWRVTNHGSQGEGLIKGNVMDYLVPHILYNKLKP